MIKNILNTKEMINNNFKNLFTKKMPLKGAFYDIWVATKSLLFEPIIYLLKFPELYLIWSCRRKG